VDFYLANLGYKIVGVDISESAIESCRKSASELGLEDKLEFRKLDFPEEKPREKFDFVICSEVLEHLQNDGKATRAIFGLLNPRGIVIFSVPSKNAPLYKIGTTGAFDKKAGHLRRYSLKELKNLTLRAGFLIQETIKKEGVLRNFLFLNPIAGKFVRILNKIEFLSELFTFIDDLTIPLFGESDVFLVARKP
jgi:SAM-dependent methyltransferase